MEIKGIDTIDTKPLKLPSRVEIEFDTLYIGQRVVHLWNVHGMSMLPYCTECREPLNWFIPPEGDLLLKCPKCEREWVKDNDWLMKDEVLLYGKRKGTCS